MSEHDEAMQPPALVETKPFGLTHAWGLYAGAVGFCAILLSLAWYGIAVLAYLATGFVMSRFVVRQLVEFHPMYHTVAMEFSTKIRMLFFWPFQMLGLLFKLTPNRVL